VKSRISSKGQVTVPAEVREALGLYEGTPVVFEVREGGAWMHKGGSAEHPLDLAYGLLKDSGVKDSLALLDEMRGQRPGGPRARPRRRGRR